MSKLWQKNNEVASAVEKFTIGNDQAMDQYLASYDVLGSIAHITMLSEVGLLTADELVQLKKALVEIYQSIQDEKFTLAPGVEDIHSQVEILLTSKLGDVGKKIHSARSRNDQVLVDIKLFLRAELIQLSTSVNEFFNLLQTKSELHKNDLLPGYTHLQLAMPSSFGLWLGAYAESLVDDMTTRKIEILVGVFIVLAVAAFLMLALKVANAYEFVKDLPNGINTSIGDSGNRLSGGQKQRLSIARAVLKNPPIMILDEATSALDTESEKFVQVALENMMQNRTSVVIAHRLSTIQKADVIVVMQKGEIVEQGNHDELIAKDGMYARLVSMQSFE